MVVDGSLESKGWERPEENAGKERSRCAVQNTLQKMDLKMSQGHEDQNTSPTKKHAVE